MTKAGLLSSAVSAAFMAAVCAATPAHALEAKQCGTRDEIVQALQEEGQVEVISGQRTAVGGPRNTFTTNSSLNLGYNLEAGTGSEAGKSALQLNIPMFVSMATPNFAVRFGLVLVQLRRMTFTLRRRKRGTMIKY